MKTFVWRSLAVSMALAPAFASSSGNAASRHPRSYYPKLTRADLEVCRPQFLIEKNRQLTYLAKVNETKAYNELAPMDPMDAVFDTTGGGDELLTILNSSSATADEIEDYADWAVGMKAGTIPGRAAYPADSASLCILNVWLAKLDAKKSGAKPPPSMAAAKPSPAPVPGVDMTRVNAQLAICRNAIGAPSTAIAACTALMKDGAPEAIFTQAYSLRGTQQLRAKNYALAAEDFSFAMGMGTFAPGGPEFATALYGAGLAKIGLGQNVDGTSDVNRAVAMYSTVQSAFAQYQLTPPRSGSGNVGATPSPGTGSYVVDPRRASGGVSVTGGPDQTGVSTVASPKIRDTPPSTTVAGAGSTSPATGTAGGRKFSINPTTGAPCVTVTGTGTEARSDGRAIYLYFANSCNKQLSISGERFDKRPAPMGPVSQTGIGPLKKGYLVCIDYSDGTGCTGWKSGWGN